MAVAKDKPSILLVDDEPEILFSLKGLLRREYNLYTAESGKEALALLREHPIDVIMTDQRMPEMTGIELMGKVKAEHPTAIRIVFTGYADIRAVIDAINNGGLFRYITKPWDPDDLMEVLQQAVAAHVELVSGKQLLGEAHAFVRDVHSSATKNSQGVPLVQSDEWQQYLDRAASLLPKLSDALQSAARTST